MSASTSRSKRLAIWLLPILSVAAGIGLYLLNAPNKESNEKSGMTAASSKERTESADSFEPNNVVEDVERKQRIQSVTRHLTQAKTTASAAGEGTASDLEPPRDDDRFMTALRALWFPNPKAALKMAEQGERRFAGTPLAEECAWISVRALTELGDHEGARVKSKEMVNAYPDSKWTMDVVRHVLSYPPGM